MIEVEALLIGGGHAQVAVLEDWITHGTPVRSSALLTPARFLRYSGMVPGWIAGEHGRNDGRVDLAALARAAGARMILSRCTGIDADGRVVTTSDAGAIRFAFASIDTGGVGRARQVLGDGPRILEVRPIELFVDQLERWFRDRARTAAEDAPRIVVVGGGAGGVELAFGLRNAALPRRHPEVMLISGGHGLLPGFGKRTVKRARGELARQGIAVIEEDATIASGTLVAGTQAMPADLIVAALGSNAPDWPRISGLRTDPQGFIAVDAHQRLIDQPHIFAAGDVARRCDRMVPHSGVHAVFAGPVLAANLRAAIQGHAPRRAYDPRFTNLYILSTGNGEAIASYGPLALQGRLAALLKARIDKGWIARYATLGVGA
ncbi:MAG: FAD-dependent oxidoreductase [Erythrobacter sp.]|jgi:NADH dehydrogenase FAD-containing subunit|nr:FAD-dependent oxidoreductase [Erythrobacter sp.]